MEIEQTYLIEGGFLCNGKQVNIKFMQNSMIIEGLTPKPQKIVYDFYTKIKIFRAEGKITHIGPFCGFTLESVETLTFFSDDQALMTKVRDYFRTRVNMRGFHELFKAIKKIGKGSFASVYLAQRLEDKLMVAVKAFSKQVLKEQDKGMASLINQIKLIRQLHHPHIMQLLEVYQSQNSIYMIVELIQEGQLYTKIQSKHIFTPKEVKKIMRGLLEGLQHLHQRDIMHRDLKPENILFRDQLGLDIVICDFGLATWAHEPEYIYVRCGTPGYVAPEIVNIKDMKTKSDPICDIFSAGLIFHILLYGQSIFKGKNYNEVLAQNRACNFKFEGPPYDTTPKAALSLLMAMLDKNPKTRISAKEALKQPYFTDDGTGANQSLPTTTTMVDSPYLGPKGQAKKQSLKEDSCVKFVMKETTFTGKISSVQSTSAMDSPGMVKNISQTKKPAQKSRFNKFIQQDNDEGDQKVTELMKMA